MPKQLFVVQIEGTSLYLTSYNIGVPSSSGFGNKSDAVTFTTLAEAQQVAGDIGGGTVGTPKQYEKKDKNICDLLPGNSDHLPGYH